MGITVVDACIKSKFRHDIFTLARTTGDTDGATSLDLCYLAYH
jgi:hypothetical protein